MPFVRSSVSKRRARVVAVILSLGKIMPTYSRYIGKRLVYIVIIAPFSRQLSSYTKCTYTNIPSSYDIRMVSNAEYIFHARYINF